MIETAFALLDLQHARRLARRGAEPPRELGEVVRPVQLVDRFPPPVAVDEVVPVGDQVAERAAVVAERDAALHAARRLLTQLGQRQRPDELAEVADALRRGALGRLAAPDPDECSVAAHSGGLPSVSRVTKPAPPADASAERAP